MKTGGLHVSDPEITFVQLRNAAPDSLLHGEVRSAQQPPTLPLLDPLTLSSCSLPPSPSTTLVSLSPLTLGR